MLKWLDLSGSSNRYRQMYIKGFLDISGGNLILRNNHLHVLSGDASFGNNIYVTNTANINKIVVKDISVNGNFLYNYPPNSIPTTAINGGIPLADGIFSVDVSFNNRFSVAGSSKFNELATFKNGLTVSGNSLFTNSAQFNAKTTLNADASLNANLYVNGVIYNNGSPLETKFATVNSPTFTGTVSGITSSMVGLGNVDNTSDILKPVSNATQTAINVIVGNPPATMKTLQSLAAALSNDPSFGTNLTNSFNTSIIGKASVTNPSFITAITTPKLFVTSDASLNARLFVAGDTSMNGNLRIGKQIYEGGQSLITKYATLANPTFTGTVSGITSTMVGLGNVDNTSDALKPVSVAQQTALDLKANIASPSFTGVPTAPTASVGTNTTQLATTAYVRGEVASLIASAPAALDTLNELANALGNDASFSTTISTAIGLRANIASPTFTGTVSGITASMVGLGNVDNTSDVLKPVSVAQQTALDLKANNANPTFTGTVSGITASMVGLGNVDNTSDVLKPVSVAQQTALDLKANIANPTFTGTVSGITASMIGLGNVDNTSDVSKPVSTAQQTALDLKANIASPTFTGTTTIPTAQITNITVTSDATINSRLYVAGDVSFNGNLNAPMISENGTTLISKYATLASPTFTGTVSGITSSMVGLGNVNNTSDALKPVSTAQQTALDLKANIASPTFTGTTTIPTAQITNLTVASDVSLNSRIFINGSSIMNGDISANSGLFLHGNAILGSQLTVLKSSIFTEDVSIHSRLSVDSDSSFNGNIAIGKQLQVIGNTTITGDTSILGQASFNTDVSLNNNVDISGAIMAHNNINVFGVINQQSMNIYDGVLTSFDSTMIQEVNSLVEIVNIATNSTNTIIGKNAGQTSGTNTIVLGNQATPSTSTVSNEITLGNSSITTLRCATNTITSLSDARDKTNVENLDIGLDLINALKPVSFDWNMRDSGKIGIKDIGFIAQDLLTAQESVGKIIPNLVNSENPDRLEASYATLIPVLVKAIQELQKEVEFLKNKI